jgi:hypothetical protein
MGHSSSVAPDDGYAHFFVGAAGGKQGAEGGCGCDGRGLFDEIPARDGVHNFIIP